MPRFRILILATLLLSALTGSARAQGADGGSKSEAERALQGYLALWSSEGDVSPAAVSRFYAPRVVYYGKSFTRAQVLADKLAYARHWPVRHYREVPGSFAAQCNADRSFCKVSADMTWRRVSTTNAVSTGRAHLVFEFVAVDGGRKIAREGARIL